MARDDPQVEQDKEQLDELEDDIKKDRRDYQETTHTDDPSFIKEWSEIRDDSYEANK